MISQENMSDIPMPQELRDAVEEFFSFTEENGISYWDRRDWAVEKYSGYVGTLFFRPLFLGHERMNHSEEFRMALDFLREKTGNRSLHIGFFVARGKNLLTREELRASREPKTEETPVGEVDFKNLTEAVSIESIFKNAEKQNE